MVDPIDATPRAGLGGSPVKVPWTIHSVPVGVTVLCMLLTGAFAAIYCVHPPRNAPFQRVIVLTWNAAVILIYGMGLSAMAIKRSARHPLAVRAIAAHTALLGLTLLLFTLQHFFDWNTIPWPDNPPWPAVWMAPITLVWFSQRVLGCGLLRLLAWSGVLFFSCWAVLRAMGMGDTPTESAEGHGGEGA